MKPVSIHNSTHYHWGPQCDGWHLVQTAQLSVIQEKIPPGGHESPHYHKQCEQFFFVLSGVASITLDGISHTLHSHQGIHVAAGIVHQVSNNDQQDLIFTVTSAPPSHGDRVEILGQEP